MRLHATDRGHPQLDGIVDRALGRNRRCLRHAIGDRHFAHVHLVDDALHHLDRARTAGHDAGAQRRKVEFRKIGMVERADEHGRHAVEGRAALFRHGLQHGERIEGLCRIDQRRAMRQRAEIGHHHAEAMVERNRHADLVLVGEPDRLADEESVV